MSEYTYSAFISYKHDPDETFAAAIQEQIEHFMFRRPSVMHR